MNKKIVDALGQKCPIPVIMTKNAIKEIGEGNIEVLVDNEISLKNIEKFCEEKGFSYSNIKEDKIFKVNILVKNIEKESKKTDDGESVIVIDSLEMGKGDEKLGKTLLKGFIYTLTELETLPETLIFYNKGVLLTTEDSESLEDLQKLQDLGVKIEICGACVNFYGVTEKVKVGNITNMYNIINIQMKSKRVIKP